jgi:5-methylcytosine-specific restriction enzyme B
MPYVTHHEDRPELQAEYDGAAAFVEAGLRTDGSLFTPGVSVWGLAAIDDLYKRFNENPDESSDSFENKFRRQLHGAPPITVQLAGELIYVHLLIASDISGKTKRALINEVLSWSDAPVQIPTELDQALNNGLVSTGISFKTRRPNQLWFLLDFLRAWKAEPPERQRTLLEDPWAFRTFVFDLPMKAAQTQREALLHLVHPVAFEDIVSREHKQMIATQFKDRVHGIVDNVDQELAQIRSGLENETGGPINFYRSPLVEQWRPPGAQHAWLVRGSNVGGKNLVPEWLEGGYCAIAWNEAGPIDQGLARHQIRLLVERAYPDDKPGAWRTHVGNLYRFLTRMQIGDLVVTNDGSNIYVGVVTSSPTWEPTDPLLPRHREVDWANPERPIAREDLSEAAFSKLRTLLTVSDVTPEAHEFARLSGLETGAEEGEGSPTPFPATDIVVPTATDALAARVLVPKEWLSDALELLTDKLQLIFYGPPGTGKTYLAQQLASHITSNGGSFTLVQFHPSYAYEDFIEGFRPRQTVDTESSISFELTPGPLRQIADAARNDLQHPYVLIIDEINRANLAKVFGELYFLLEYRDAAISLQYSPEDEFSLPPNLFIIGTMNTADRSIALIDAAMRRRFYFIAFLPSQPPIAGLLRRWLSERKLGSEAADLLDALNRRIDNDEAEVGPSYLMTVRVDRPGGLERIWRHALLPLLEEHFYGTGIDIEERFGLPALRRDLRRTNDSSTNETSSTGEGLDVATEDTD